MSDSLPNSVAPVDGESVTPLQNKKPSRQVLAALFSALVPGAGQLLIGRQRKGFMLLFVFVAILSCVWPLRLPRFYAGLISIILAWLGLSLYAGCSALFDRATSTEQPSRWWLLAIVPATYIGINLFFTPLFLVSGFRALKFSSSAMQKTLSAGDQFIFDKNYYLRQSVTRNDLVVMRRADYQTVKRVVAIGGDTIEGKDRGITLNGQLIAEPFIQHTQKLGTTPGQDSFGPISVPAGKYFVMGDNRDFSLDSRAPDFGLIDSLAIVGKPIYLYRSPTKGWRRRNLH
jgi:signal peptidase I